MKQIVFLAIVLVALSACSSRRTGSAVAKIQLSDSINNSPPAVIRPILRHEIDRFIDDMVGTTYEKWPVLILFIGPSKKGRIDSCINITANISYRKSGIIGYVNIKNKIIAIAKYRGLCFDDFIDTSQLIRSLPPNMKEYDPYLQSEPYTRRYRIVSADSLQLIYDGHL